MPKYGRFNFPPEPVITRKGGSDWITDVNGKKLRLRSWSAVDAEWKLSKLGLEYYKQFQSEWVVSIPCHHLIAKPGDREVSYSKGSEQVTVTRSGTPGLLSHPTEAVRGSCLRPGARQDFCFLFPATGGGALKKFEAVRKSFTSRNVKVVQMSF